MTDFFAKVQEYYNLKDQYETNYAKLKAPILKDKQLSKKEKREAVARLAPKCINCGRPVGTIFAITVSEDSLERHLTAACGDQADPCPLKIDLSMGETRPLPISIKEEEAALKALRDEVILLKNRLLVGAITNDQVLERFDELKDSINTSNQMLEYYLDLYTKIAANPEMQKRRQRTEVEKFRLKDEMGRAMRSYRNTGTNKFVQDAVEIYVKQFQPLASEELGQMYGDLGVTTKWETLTRMLYILVEARTTIGELEHSLTEPKVIAFTTGYMAPKGPRRGAKTAKAAAAPPQRKRLVLSSEPSVEPSVEPSAEES